ncbi:calcium-binding protein [Microvirga rosea]|uniref:calcium-binding protein n=1 Tax=Microvirga rosea TaxID=2715425 RepID=UPI001D0A214C|nr:calcium-binding protein [Microvirga rosea]MCB8819507.1 hypothetical protein [Microvirga rosea]
MTFKIWGTENTIDTDTTVGRDSVTMLATGGYVVTWRQNKQIAYQLYDGEGTADGDIRFVEASTLDQEFSDVYSYDPDGGFVIQWSEKNPVTGRTIKSQKFTFDGSDDSNAVTLTDTAVYDDAEISADGSQNAWATAYVEKVAGKTSIRLVQFGTAVDIAEGSSVGNPDVAWLGNTKHVVTWKNGTAVSLAIVNDGASTVKPTAITGATSADVVALNDPETGQPNGTFAIITEKGAAGIEAHLYDSSGNPLKDQDNQDIVVTVAGAKPNSDFDCASVTALKDGGFAVAYIAKDGTDDGDVFVRVIGADGAAGNPMKVNNRATIDSHGSQTTPVISEMADGRLSISWHDPAITDGIAPSIISSTIVDARTGKVTVNGTSHNDIYAPSEYTGDSLDGGEGIDTLTFKGASAGVAVNLANEAEGQSGSAGDAASDTYKNFENINGSAFGDHLVGAAGTNRLDGGAGNDYLDGGTDNDVMIGGAGSDTFVVSQAGDAVQESSAADGGVDTINTSVSHVLEAYVENMIATGPDAITLTGNGLSNNLVGNGNNNTLVGGGGDDVMNGGGGADDMDGGAGNDTYYVDNASDFVHDSGSGDVDTVVVTINYDLNKLVGIENITGSGSAAITLTGNAGNNILNGNDGPNIIYGGAGNDVLNGYGGNDRLHGGLGADRLTGGTGRDIFVFDTNPKTARNTDKIVDFSVKDDSIYLENKYFKVGSKGTINKPAQLSSKMFHVGTKAHDKDDRLIYDNKKGVLYYDDDGIGSHKAYVVATLSQGLKMTYKDFFVI